MVKTDSFERFYDALQQITVINEDLQRKREALKVIFVDFDSQIQSMKQKVDTGVKNKKIDDLLEETLNSLNQASADWLNLFEQMLEKERFRSDLENYFIVMVFGKVKAGKSSLGNFIARHKPENRGVVFFKYDEAGKERSIKKLQELKQQGDEGFATNNLECTSSIQGFRLDGLAWIDTPGLGSMTVENGKLAKDYINSADYIVYLTPSDSPMQQDEVKQIEELFQYGKKVSICITKSDRLEKKKDEQGKFVKQDGRIVRALANKSANVRSDQEAYVHQQIVSLVGTEQSLIGDVISVSVHSAQAGLEQNDIELFENSNITKLYALLTDVVENKAEQLKKETPYNSLIAFIDNDVLGVDTKKASSITGVREKLEELASQLDETNTRLNDLIENVKSDISCIVSDTVEQHYQNIQKNNAKQIFSEIYQSINEQVQSVVTANIEQLFEGVRFPLDALTNAMVDNEFEINDVRQQFSYSTTERNKRIGGALGALAAAGVAFMTGGASLLVSAAGAVAGSYLGGKAGEMTGSHHTDFVVVGDNKEEVVSRFKERQIAFHEANCQRIYADIRDAFFEPLTGKVAAMRQSLNNCESRVETFKQELS